MDWYVDTTSPSAVGELKTQIDRYLCRHGNGEDDDLADARTIISELLGNVTRHASGPAWVSLLWSGPQPVVTVYDLGPGFTLKPRLPDDPLAEGGRGLYLVAHMAERLTAAVRASGGARVSAVLPVTRPEVSAPEPTQEPPPADALPTLAEAQAAGAFGRESFLRALVVQLAQAVEAAHGPAAAEAAVSEVGAAVGGQMEAEYRAAREVVGRMTPEQIADCYVRLKQAIDGDFFPIEITDDRIVLGNTRCPFGDAVRRAPALCRMTSSVFGGIAARNTDREASVVLEERIAVGDPGCRVVVYLDRPADDPTVSHRYRTPRRLAPG